MSNAVRNHANASRKLRSRMYQEQANRMVGNEMRRMNENSMLNNINNFPSTLPRTPTPKFNITKGRRNLFNVSSHGQLTNVKRIKHLTFSNGSRPGNTQPSGPLSNISGTHGLVRGPYVVPPTNISSGHRYPAEGGGKCCGAPNCNNPYCILDNKNYKKSNNNKSRKSSVNWSSNNNNKRRSFPPKPPRKTRRS